MTDFDALLKRSFAEAHEPVDDGFCVRVEEAVAKRERVSQVLSAFQVGGTLVGALAVAWGGIGIVQGAAPEVLASIGLEAARVHGAMSTPAPSINFATLAGPLTQMLMVVASLAGGVLVYRNSQQQQ